MAKFKITLTRTWTETDTIERVVEAETADAAATIAERLARQFDQSCPDDVETSKSGEAVDWVFEDMEETEEPADEIEEASDA